MNSVLHEVLGSVVLLTPVALVFVLAARLRKQGIDPELTRKVAHFGTAVAVLPLPLLIHSLWTLPALALIAGGGVWALRKTGRLNFLDDAKRSHRSEYCFVAGIAVVRAFSGDALALYVAPMLVLGVSDALAALVGQRWGRHQFADKSLEGSLACGLSAFAIIFAVSGQWVKALVAAAAVTAVEAVAKKGTDNFLIPVSALAAMRFTSEILEGLRLILPIALAGLAHHAVRRFHLFPSLNRSLDSIFFPGREVFGANKTLRGFVVMPVAAGLGFLALGGNGLAGAVIGFAYVLAELPNSMLKRQRGIAPGATTTGIFFVLDHVDSAIGCALAFLALRIPAPVIIAGLISAPLVHVIVNWSSHALKLRAKAF